MLLGARQRSARTTRDQELREHVLPSFKKGYNSYTGSKTTVDDEEFPVGHNVILSDTGGVTKRPGTSRYTPEILAGSAISGFDWLENSSVSSLIVSAGTSWFKASTTSVSALSGATFTSGLATDFCQAVDRLYGANGTDPLSYTSNGTSVVQVTVNGNVGRFPVYYNNRIYMTNTTFRDRIYYSNPINIDYTANPPTLSTTDFATFDTNLAASPKKNAGYIVLIPGGGVVIEHIKKDINQGNESIYAYTRRHGIWQITFSSLDSNSAVVHTVRQIVTNFGTTAPRSVVKVMNDQEFFDGTNYSALGEVAQYQNLRISTKSARVKSELSTVPSSEHQDIASTFYREKLYTGYTLGSFNDRVLIRDVRLNAWSAPLSGINASCWLELVETSGARRLLYGSSDPSDSYIYEYDSGLNDNGAPIEAYFETKSTDCNLPGLIKRFAHADVFYANVFGRLTYQVFLDEVLEATGTLQLGTSSTGAVGFGSEVFGTYVFGSEGSGTAATQLRDGSFRVNIGYKKGKRVSIRFTNNNADEGFEITSVVFRYLPGSIYEQ